MSDSSVSTPVLTTSRLVLRQFRRDDAQRIHELVNDKKLAQNTHYIPYPYPEGAAEEWLEEHEELIRIGRAVVFAVCLKQEGQDDEDAQLIGTVGLAIADLDHQAEIGYWIGRKYWGRGLGSEAVTEVLEFGLETLGLHRIFAQHIARNGASAKLLERVGFSREGVLRQHARKWGVFEDVVCYGILSQDPRPGK